MKKFLIGLSCVLIVLLSIFAFVIIDTNAKAKNEKVYKNIPKENYNVKKKITEKKEESEKEQLEEEKIEQDENIEEQETEDFDVPQTYSTNEDVEDYSNDVEYNNVNYGTFGRLYVSWYSAAVYDYNVNTSNGSSLQTIVDNYDSAAYYINHGKLIIADHNYQGFSVLASLTEGQTAYIQFEDGSTIGYRLIKKSKGYNTGPDLIDTYGNSFFNMDSDIIMYTCYEDGIMATLWALA